MLRTNTLGFAVLLPSLLWAANPVDLSKDKVANAPLSDVLKLGDDVLAVNEFGIYRAAAGKHEWERIDTPAEMPLNGKFASGLNRIASGEKNPSRLIYCSPMSRRQAIEKDGRRYGLYISDDRGRTWRLASTAARFSYVYVLPPTIFAVTKVENTKDGKTYFRDRLLKSTDDCRTWTDITGDIAPGVMLYSIFDDPDHDDDICIRGNTLRAVILQRDDRTATNWNLIYEMNWDRDRVTDATFLEPQYSTSWRAEVLPATLANYFQHEFGEQTQLPAFELVTDQSSYEFAADDRKRVNVEIKLRDNNASDRLVDLREGMECWLFRVIRPDGKREHLFPENLARNDERKQEFRARKDFTSFVIDGNAPYRRSIDLEAFGPLHEPGTYKVLVLYHNEYVADRGHKEWPGTVSAKTIAVRVR